MIDKINYPEKHVGDKFTHGDANEIKNAINNNADVLSTLQELADFVKVGNNLFNKATYVPNYYVDGDSGLLLSGLNWWASDFIQVKPNTQYRAINGVRDRAYYDVNKNYISGASDVVNAFTTPNNTAYLRFSGFVGIDVNSSMLNEGATALPYEPFTYQFIYSDATIVSRINESFVNRTKYDDLTAVITAESISQRSIGDISGWGAIYNKTGVTFNAIRLPAGTSYYPEVPTSRIWKYAQIVVKNAKTDVSFIAKSPLIDISGYDILPEIVYPLMNPELTEFITLTDSSFSGSTYWINIYYYNADKSFAYGGIVNGIMPNQAENKHYYTVSNSINSWNISSEINSIDFEHVIVTNPKEIKHLSELDDIQEQIDALKPDTIEINLPDKINAIVGDTLQLFIRGMIKAVNPYNYDIIINCSKGKMYPRYFEYTPVTGDIGTVTFNVKVKSNDGKVLATKTCNLVTKSAVQAPSTNKKILFIGDSLTNARIYPVEAYRRLTQSGGTPAGLGYSNISFVGRKKSSYGIGVEGNIGWSWSDFLTVGVQAFTFQITQPTVIPAIEATYIDANGSEYWMWWDYSTTSIKMVSIFRTTPPPPSSGILTKLSGDGDNTITYSSFVQSSGNPFWNDSTGTLDFTGYVNKWCGGSLDVVYTLLTWNGQYGNRTDFSAFTNYARTLFNHIKTAYPNIKIKIMGVQLADLKQGMRVNGSPSENTYTDQYGLVVTALNMNKAYQDLANEVALSGFVEFVNVSSQVDSEYNMPYTDKAVNTRNSINESVGTNDVHPNENGYNQIADVIFRNFVANFCQ